VPDIFLLSKPNDQQKRSWILTSKHKKLNSHFLSYISFVWNDMKIQF